MLERRIEVGATSLAAATGVLTSVVGFVVADRYRPHDALVHWHGVACVAFLLVTIVALVLVVRAPRRSRLSIGTAALALVAAAATVLTRPLVQWDQLALWSVTVGTNIHGYWYAAHDDSVRFLLIGGSEVTQGQYAPMVLLHVLAPVVGAIAAAATAVLVLRRPQESG